MLFGEKMNLTDALVLPRTGKVLKNRTVLAAMTNKQSHENGILSEEEGHHPDIEFGWGYVNITILTHKIGGLHENDFILAAKIDEIG